MKEFINNDEGYELWFSENRKGYIFNFFGGPATRADMNKFHKANCPHLWRQNDKGKRTTTYPKICSNNYHELVSFIEETRGSSWSTCRECKPDEQ